MLRFVMKNTHAEKSSNPAETECGYKQCLFGNAPGTASGFPFIDAIHTEGDKGHRQNGEGGELPVCEDGLTDCCYDLHRLHSLFGLHISESESYALSLQHYSMISDIRQ